MTNRIAILLACILISPSFHRAQDWTRGKADVWGSLRASIVDRASGKPVTARCYLTDPTKQSWSPVGAVNYVKPPERHFIAEGGFQIALPRRKYTLTVERGAEYRPVMREIEIAPGEAREEKIELDRWIDMNDRGWYSGDLHNHRDWREMPQLLMAEDLNLAPTLTQWVWEDGLTSKAPPPGPGFEAVRQVDDTHVYSVVDTEIERLMEGPGAVDLVGLTQPVEFRGYRLSPPNDVFVEAARRQGGYVDAEKITWRDVAALVALGHVDFAGIVHNHFNRHGVGTETRRWGMIPKEKPEYDTPAGMPFWAMDVYYKFLNCGFKLPVSAGSASGVKASPPGYCRVYVHTPGKFGYDEWFRALKAGRSFATNGPMLFLTVNGQQPGNTIRIRGRAGKSARLLKVRAEAISRAELDRLEILWKGSVVKTVRPGERPDSVSAEFDVEASESGWIVARAFEKPLEAAHFAHTSPVYVKVGRDSGIVREDAEYFLKWIDREIAFYKDLSSFRSEQDRQGMLELFRQARAVYEKLAARSE
jgi:hypothetical protein